MLLYTNINHVARKQLGISTNEYCIADMIYHLSSNPESRIKGWCNMSRSRMGDEMGLSKRSAISIIARLIEDEIIEKSATGLLRTTKKWYKTVIVRSEESSPKINTDAVKKVHRIGEESSPQPVKKVHRIGEESSHNKHRYNNSDKNTHTETYDRVVFSSSLSNSIINTSSFNLSDFLEFFPGQKSTWRLEQEWMKIDGGKIEAIKQHIPKYAKSNEQRYLKSAINYIKGQEWECPVVDRNKKKGTGLDSEIKLTTDGRKILPPRKSKSNVLPSRV